MTRYCEVLEDGPGEKAGHCGADKEGPQSIPEAEKRDEARNKNENEGDGKDGTAAFCKKEEPTKVDEADGPKPDFKRKFNWAENALAAEDGCRIGWGAFEGFSGGYWSVFHCKDSAPMESCYLL